MRLTREGVTADTHPGVWVNTPRWGRNRPAPLPSAGVFQSVEGGGVPPGRVPAVSRLYARPEMWSHLGVQWSALRAEPARWVVAWWAAVGWVVGRRWWVVGRRWVGAGTP